jgi:hypothetical protein
MTDTNGGAIKSMTFERSEDCALCGERFHGADIAGWLREREDGTFVHQMNCIRKTTEETK